jgi:amicyanin
MRGRRVGWIIGAVLVALLAVGAVGSVASAAAWHGSPWWPQPRTTSSTPGGYGYGPGGMMGGSGNGYGHGGMMGGYGQNGYGPGSMMGPGGMMGGYDGAQTSATPVTGVTQVTIHNFAFQPASIQVKAGTMVTWTNQDTAPHTVTFRSGAQGSGTLQQGQSFSYTFTQAGTYDYFCAVHPSMVGRVVVTS